MSLSPIILSSLLALSGRQIRIGSIPTIPNGIVVPPQVAHSTVPAYTPEARLARIEGIVTIEAAFDIDGNIKVLKVLKGLGHGLDENAIAALKDWRFLPATRNGARVEVVAQIDVEFKMPTPPPIQVFRVGGGITAPSIVRKVDPQYPPEAKERRIQGTVVLEAMIRADGTVEIVRVVRSLDPSLDESARKALEQWKFKPGMRNGKAVNISINVEINFNLR